MGRHSKDYDQQAQDKADDFDRQYEESLRRAERADNSAFGQYERGVRKRNEGR